ncbi:MAG TPA: AraC family transcriptional regulator [Thermoanaerobaculia bacterium]
MPKPTIRIDDAAGRAGPIFAGRQTGFPATAPRSAVTHDYAGLVFCVSGSSRIEFRTAWTLAAGDVLMVPAGEPHRSVEAGQADVWYAGFCVPCLAAETAAGLLAPFDRVRNGASPIVRIPAGRHPFLETLFRELSVAPADALARQSLLTLILTEVRRAAESAQEAGSETTLVAETLRYIERHCLEPLTLTAVAAAMHRTPSHITTALTRATGRSAVAWIIAGRMAEARRRLLHSDEQVEIIAERVGYADPTHFIRLFRREHGATPAAWRAMQRDTAGQLTEVRRSTPARSSARDSAAPPQTSRKRRQ